MVLHNLHMLILKKKGIKEIDGAGDGTGYSLMIKTHYASAAQKLKDKKRTGWKLGQKNSRQLPQLFFPSLGYGEAAASVNIPTRK